LSQVVVLLSGGIDSTVVATLACHMFGAEKVHALSVIYGQKHKREVEAAQQVASYLGISREVVELPASIFQGAGSALIDADQEMPQMTYEELKEATGTASTYVPYRNGILLSVAAAVALRVGATQIGIGAHADDYRGYAYPDCSPEFLGPQASALAVGTDGRIEGLYAPLLTLTKSEIVRLGLAIDAPLHLTWSCYTGSAIPCGTCPTCIERAQAFMAVGCQDPAWTED
jgi:7-cyano-7-deazaguanine synthase